MSDEQSRQQLLACLEDVKLDLEELKQHSSAVAVGQAIEMLESYGSKLEKLQAENDHLWGEQYNYPSRIDEQDERIKELEADAARWTTNAGIAMERAIRAESRLEWRPASEPPDDDRSVLVAWDSTVQVGWYDSLDGTWSDEHGRSLLSVTHWMELPSAPFVERQVTAGPCKLCQGPHADYHCGELLRSVEHAHHSLEALEVPFAAWLCKAFAEKDETIRSLQSKLDSLQSDLESAQRANEVHMNGYLAQCEEVERLSSRLDEVRKVLGDGREWEPRNLQEKALDVIRWRISIEEPEFISTSNWRKDYLGFAAPMCAKDLDSVCEAANAFFEKIGSSLRVNWSMGEIIPLKIK